MNEDIILKTFAERFSLLMKQSSIDVNKLTELIGIKSKSTIYRYMNGEMAPKIPTVKYIAEIFNVNPLWLMGYDVPMKKETLKGQRSSYKRIPVLGRIPAGVPIELIEEILDYEDIPSEMLKGGKEYFALKVQGNSMEPKYLDNDIIIVLRQDNCESGQDCIVTVNGNDGTFKRVFIADNGITLQPLNAEYMPVFYSNDEVISKPVKILGVVKEIRRSV